ncbi:MAG: PAS domain S-box protein [Deltaproteobacteria bacterium]|nr:PAS domain S-box protein [Deltaproteobacteria bacterium]
MDEKAKILIVDDERTIAREMRHKLESMGYDVLAIVSSGEEAIKKAEELHPDLVLMDIILQGEVDGVEAAGQIRTRSGIPVVYVTANPSDARLENIKRSEPFGCLFKPFEDIELHATIDMALHRYKMEKKLRESEEIFRAIGTAANDGIIMIDNEEKVSYWNGAAGKIFGYTDEEILGKELRPAIMPKCFHKAFETGFSKFKVTGQGAAVGKTLELAAVKKDGTEIPIELSMSAVKIDGEWNAIGLVRDITERREA